MSQRDWVELRNGTLTPSSREHWGQLLIWCDLGGWTQRETVGRVGGLAGGASYSGIQSPGLGLVVQGALSWFPQCCSQPARRHQQKPVGFILMNIKQTWTRHIQSSLSNSLSCNGSQTNSPPPGETCFPFPGTRTAVWCSRVSLPSTQGQRS